MHIYTTESPTWRFWTLGADHPSPFRLMRGPKVGQRKKRNGTAPPTDNNGIQEKKTPVAETEVEYTIGTPRTRAPVVTKEK